MNQHTVIENTVDEVLQLYEEYGDADYIGEPVSQIEHMVQSAQLAEEQGFDDEVILAAFFHDIGHLVAMQGSYASMKGFGAVAHEKIGADFLRAKGFSEKIASLVESHVQAKRYLTFKYPEYYSKLSDASKQTLDYQGGKMSAAEAELFEKDDLCELKIRMRKWDELAKEEDIPLENLDHYRELMIRHLENPFNQ